MELLVALIGEFFGVLVFPAIALMLEFLLPILGLFVEVVSKILGVPSLLRPRRSAGAATPPSPWLRRIGKVLLGLTVVTTLLLVLLNTLLFESTLRRGLTRAREKTGVDVQFESAHGNFLTGSVTLQGVTVKRQDSLRSKIDLKIRDAKADVFMLSLMRSTVHLEGLRLVDVQGTYQRGRIKVPRRNFVIDTFIVENAALDLKEPDTDVPAPALPLQVDRLECRPLQRDSAVFDLLFRSNGQGTIAGAPFEIRTDAATHGRTTSWKARAIPVAFLAGYVGEPFDWLTAGTVDVDVADSWSDGPSSEIDSYWKLDFREVAAAVPPRITGFKRAVAEPVAKFIQAHPAHLPLEFSLKLDQGHFTGAASVETTGILKAAADGMLEEMARKAKAPVESIKELGRRALEDFKKFVERHSRKKSD
jgi:hypothetical protein